MSNRFSRESTAEIWVLLNALDDDIRGVSETTVALAFVAGTPNYAPTAYKGADGWVTVDGGVTMAAGTAPVTPAITPATWTVIATLPVGMRPKKYQYYPCTIPNVTVAAGLRINTSGTIEVLFAAATPAVMPLTAVRFRAA